MNNTSLEFFKSLLERDTKIAELLLKETSAPALTVTHTTTMPPQKPYSNIKFVNDVLTVVLNDGNIVSKHPATADDFTRARNARTEVELFAICMVKEAYEDQRAKEREIENLKALAEGAKKLGSHPEFELRDGSVYMTGIDRSLPPLLVDEFLKVIGRQNPLASEESDEFKGLKRFWMWCCLNPRAEVADKLFNFLKKNSFRITQQGFFTALRNVVTIHGGTEFVQFVSEAFNKVKAVWKKSPDRYHIFLKDGQYHLLHEDDMFEEYDVTEECEECDGLGYYEDYDDYSDDDYENCEYCDGTGVVETGETDTRLKEGLGEDLGNLTELYLDLPNREENRFTDAHTGTFDIRVGRVVNMDPAKCRWNTDDCGAEGLHFTADEINYVGCGDQSVLVLINPMKVVGIGETKGRCWEYLPIMTVPREESTKLLHDLDFDTMELDEAYAIEELEDLEEKVKEGFTAESKKYSINFPTINITDVKFAVKALSNMKKEISGRVKNVK